MKKVYFIKMHFKRPLRVEKFCIQLFNALDIFRRETMLFELAKTTVMSREVLHPTI